VANLHPFPGQELVIGSRDGYVTALLSNAQILWRARAGASVQSIQTVPNPSGRDGVLAFADENAATCLASDGSVVWQRSMPGRPTCKPGVGDCDGDGLPEMVFTLDDGTVSFLKLADGTDAWSGTLPAPCHPSAITLADIAPRPGTELLVSAGDSLLCLTSRFEVLWTAPLNTTTPVCVAPGAAPSLLVSTGDAGLFALDPTGAVLWRDTRSTVPIDGSASVATQSLASFAVYTSRDGVIRCIHVP
jgi:outer membrane protein assembly factor BamB